MSDTFVYPNQNSTVIPLFELSGDLRVAYGRNLEKSYNRYSKVTPVKSRVGNFMRFNPKDLARLVNLEQDMNWPLGTPAKTGYNNTQGFTSAPFRTDRKQAAVTLDKTVVDVSSFPIMKTHTSALAQKMHTYMAYRICSALTTTANFDASHVFTATTASGTGVLSGGTTADPRIKNAFDYAARIIQADTYGAVNWTNLSVLMNSTTAQKLSSTREIREYVMQQASSRDYIEMKGGEARGIFGLPSVLYGYKVIVEDIFYNPANKNNSGETATPVMPDNTIVVLLNEGDLEVPEGASSFATCHRFAYEEYTLETKDDTWNRLVDMRCVMDFDVQIVAPPTGCIITNIFS